MESTLRSLVSTLRTSHKLLSSDGSLTDRALAAEIKNAAFLLLKRETDKRKLWATDTIFTPIPCLALQEVPITECCDYEDECQIARTKVKLPRIGEGNYQYLIQGVYSINALGGKGKRLTGITINRYINLLKLPLVKKEDYYFIYNDYLYVTNPLIQAITLNAFFEEDVPNEILYADCNCGKNVSDEEYCKNPLDKKFALPGNLQKQVLDLASQKLLSTYFPLKKDISADGIDGQSPNSKPTN